MYLALCGLPRTDCHVPDSQDVQTDLWIGGNSSFTERLFPIRTAHGRKPIHADLPRTPGQYFNG